MGPDVNSATSPVHGARNHKGCPAVAKRKAPDLFVRVRGSETLDINYSHSKVDLYLEIASRVLVVFSIVAIPQYCITHALVMTSKMRHFSIGRSVFLRSEAMSLIRDSITSRISFLYESVISSELAWINGLRCLSFSASRRTFFELSIEE